MVTFLNEPELNCLHTVKWFPVLLLNTNSFICTQLIGFNYCYVIQIILFNSYLIAQLNSFKYRKWLNSSIWPIDETLMVNITPSQSGLESNRNEGVLYIPQSSRTRASLSDSLVSYPRHSLRGGGFPLCRDAVGVFYIPMQQDCKHFIDFTKSKNCFIICRVDDYVVNCPIFFICGVIKM